MIDRCKHQFQTVSLGKQALPLECAKSAERQQQENVSPFKSAVQGDSHTPPQPVLSSLS
jgi:hypothetical protein